MNKYALKRAVSAIAVCLVIGLVIAFVLTSVLGLRSIAVVLNMWLFWLIWAPITIGVTLAAVLRRGRGPVSHGGGGFEQVNDIYLGRTSTAVERASDQGYSAYPPNENRR